MDDDKTNDQFLSEVAQTIHDMDAAVGHTTRVSKPYTDPMQNPDWFLEEAMKINKLSLELLS